MIDFAQNPEYLDFYKSVLGIAPDFEMPKMVWITKLNTDGSIAAVVGFRNFVGATCEISIASDCKSRWATRKFLAACYGYAFNQMKLRRVHSVVNQINTPSLRATTKLGHIYEATLKGFFGEHDGVLMRMLKEECRWI